MNDLSITYSWCIVGFAAVAGVISAIAEWRREPNRSLTDILWSAAMVFVAVASLILYIMAVIGGFVWALVS